jgi:hypothetical protein
VTKYSLVRHGKLSLGDVGQFQFSATCVTAMCGHAHTRHGKLSLGDVGQFQFSATCVMAMCGHAHTRHELCMQRGLHDSR